MQIQFKKKDKEKEKFQLSELSQLRECNFVI